MRRTFKDWVIPGPQPAEDFDSRSALQNAGIHADDVSCDALSGHYKIYQLKKGHRYSTDDLLVAWYGSTHAPSPRRVLDLGSGIGSVAMTAAWRLAGASFVTLEAQEISVALSRVTVARNELENRFDIRHGDLRESSHLKDSELFDLILSSPPYFALDTGISGDHDQKIACRFEVRGTIEDYCKTAVRHLSPGGFFVSIFPREPAFQQEKLKQGLRTSGLSLVRERPIIFKEGEPPLLSLLGMMRSTDLPPSLREATYSEPPLTIRTASGEIHPEYKVIKLSIGFPPL